MQASRPSLRRALNNGVVGCDEVLRWWLVASLDENRDEEKGSEVGYRELARSRAGFCFGCAWSVWKWRFGSAAVAQSSFSRSSIHVQTITTVVSSRGAGRCLLCRSGMHTSLARVSLAAGGIGLAWVDAWKRKPCIRRCFNCQRADMLCLSR
jgi:hypothetical protein